MTKLTTKKIIKLTILFIKQKLISNKINYISLFDGVLVSSIDKELVLELVNNNVSDINSCIKFK